MTEQTPPNAGEMAYTDEQLSAIRTHDRNLILLAGAGSGKTRVLVARYLALLEANPDWQLNEMVAITFTEEAALEMRNRVRQALEARLRASTSEDMNLWSQRLAQMDSARISTIHGLCANILRANAAEAGIDPGFSVIDPIEMKLLIQDVVEECLQSLTQSDPDGYLQLLQDYSPRDVTAILSRPELIAIAEVPELQSPEEIMARWRTEWFHLMAARREAMLNEPAMLELREAMPHEAPPAKDRFFDEVWLPIEAEREALFNNPDVEAWYAQIQKFNTTVNARLGNKSDPVVLEAKALIKACNELIKKLIKQISPLAEADERAAQALARWLGLLRMVKQRYQAIKQAQQQLDFDDLERIAAQLLSQNESVRKRYRSEAFRHVLVDEFQDTNGAQWQIVNSLADLQAQGSLFVVGDIKQSIYSFRGADISVFGDVRTEILQTGGKALALTRSFRSHSGLLDIFNKLFQRILQRKPYSIAADFQVAMAESDLLTAHRQEKPTPTPLEITLLEGASHGFLAEDVREWEAALIAERLQADVEAGLYAYGDVALLFQTLNSVQPFEEAFKKRGMPYVTLSGKGYFNRQEVWDVLNVLRAIFNPADELALMSALRSPIFGMSDDALLALRHIPDSAEPAASLWETLMQLPDAVGLGDAALMQRLLWTRTCLQNLRGRVGRVSVLELLHSLLAETGYLATLSGLSDPHRRRGNVEKLIELAERSGRISVDDFLRYVQDLSTNEAREGEAVLDASGAMRLMSIHASKGLEFEVVVLPQAHWERGGGGASPLLIYDEKLGLACKTRDPLSEELEQAVFYKHIEEIRKEREAAERLRLFYVAMTRAKDRLLVFGQVTRKGKDEMTLSARGWLGLLLQTCEIESLEGDALCDVAAPGDLRVHLPTPDAALMDIPEREPAAESALAVALRLPLPLLKSLKSRPSDFLGHISVTQLSEIGSSHAFPAQTLLASALADTPARVNKALRTLDPRVTHRLVGEIVHEALRYWRFPDETEQIDRILAAYAWRFQLTHEAEMAEAITRAKAMLRRFTQSDIYKHIVAARQQGRPVYPELPFIYRNGQRILHGVLDMLFQQADESWVIVDYKTGYVPNTDQNLSAALQQHTQRYYLQVGAYALAVAQELGQTPRVYIHYLRYHQAVEVLPEQWQPAIEQLERYIGDVIGARDD